MKRSMVLGGVMLLAMLANAPLMAAGKVVSLRGDQEISNESQTVEIKHWQDRDPIPRNYVQQPPLVPHTTEGYVINQKVNKCLTCHSWANYKQAKATKISQTHFADREGNDLANISARRYFCTQCHVPQAEAAPLVENTFQPLPSVQH